MRKFAILLSLLLVPLACLGAGNVITATVSVTNAAGTTNGQTIAVGADTRTWTNSVSIPATQILTNSTAGGSATNLFNHLASYGFAGISETHSGTNGVALRGTPGLAFTVTLSDGWGAVSYATNYLTNAFNLRLPITVESPQQQTNIGSMLVQAIDGSWNTNAIHESSAVAANLVGLTNNQTVTGNKAFTGSSNYIVGAYLPSPKTTNLVNYGNAISSPGSATYTLQLGQSALAQAQAATAVGYSASAQGISSSAIGTGSGAMGNSGTAIGALSYAGTANYSTALGAEASVGDTHANSTAVGYGATTTAANQIMLGSAGISAVVNNYLSVLGGLTVANGATNLLQTGTNTVAGDLAFPRYAISTLANGVNAAVPIGTNIFVEVSGPTASFSIDGINGQPNRDGKIAIIVQQTGQAMTINNQSGSEPTAANRIICLTGSNKAIAGPSSAAIFIYSAAASRWICLSYNQ